MTEQSAPPESARAKRARIKAEREAAVAAAIAQGLSPEEAEAAADRDQRERAKAEAIARSRAAAAAKAEAAPQREPVNAAPPTPAVAVAATGPTLNATKRAEENPDGPSNALLRRFLEPSKAPRRIGTLIYLVGIIDILSTLWHPWRARWIHVAPVIPGAVTTVSVASVVAGVLLIFLGHSVKRAKRRAWAATVVLLALSAISHLLRGVHRAPVAFALVLISLALLIYFRKAFRAKGDPRTKWGALGAFVLLVLASVVVGWLAIMLNSRAYADGSPGVFTVLLDVIYGMVGGDLSPYFRPGFDRFADAIGVLLPTLTITSVLIPVLLFFRTPKQVSTLSVEDDQRVRALLAEHPDSLGYFATRQDKELLWSETGKACIGYRVLNGCLLASGDPIGDPEAWPGAIKAFLDKADAHGWVPAVLGCSELAGNTWVRETGFEAFELGDEAIVDTTTFSLEGRPMRNVRQMVNRVRRQGYETSMLRVRDTPEEMRSKALADADAWRVGGTERGFSMATSRVFDAERDPDAVVIVATKDGDIEGMLQFVPWGPDGMSLDLMRRNPQADPGINELLIADALALAPGLGINRVSLNFAMFRSTFERGERLGAGPVLRLWRRLLIIGNRWFQLESLYKFNAKFQPQWFPRFVIFPRVTDLARVGIAMGEAEAFIVFPRPRWPRQRQG